jgi:putative transposase
MPREIRLVLPGTFYHITARGNYRQDIFFDSAGRHHYLNLLAKRSPSAKAQIHGWCLMTNHIHLLVVPEEPDSLSACLRRVQSEYAAYVNRVHGRRAGHLWQARFYSCPVADARVWRVLRYIERNPCRAGLVREPAHYPWSTAGIRLGFESWPGLLQRTPWNRAFTPPEWAAIVSEECDPRDVGQIRACTSHGLPWGDEQFVSRFESLPISNPSIHPRGRPRLISIG